MPAKPFESYSRLGKSTVALHRMIRVHHNSLYWPAAALAGLALLILFLVDPAAASWYPPCIFHRLTGLDCPGCGSSRGLHCLLHGDLVGAADFNLLLLPALPALASGFYHQLTGRGGGVWQWFNRPRLLLWIICIFSLLRNIPGHPLSWLNASW